MKSVWLCPTRSRPGNIARLLQAWKDTDTQAALVVAVDDDDDTAGAYWRAVGGVGAIPREVILPGKVFWHYGPRLRLGPTLNALAAEYADVFETVGFLGDDHIPRTLHWDQELYAAIVSQGGGLAYGNDLLQGENLATAVLQDAAIIRTLGYFCPPEQTHLYLDNYWMDLGRVIGKLTYRSDVIIEHAHFLAGKAERDELYSEVNSELMYSSDAKAYERYRREQFPAAVKAVAELYT